MGKQHKGSGGPKTKGRGKRREEPQSEYKETVIKIKRCASVQKGGRRFSFSALAVVGDEKGRVGLGYGKANDVPSAVNKALKEARDSMVQVSIVEETLPHEVIGVFGASRVLLAPAKPGTGVIAGSSARAVLEACGIKNVLTKSFGNNNPINLVKATMQGLLFLKTKKEISELRGVDIT